MKKAWQIAFALGLACEGTTALAQVKAFAEAEGFGQYAKGARTILSGAEIYHVTNLNDSGPGSFREAVSGSNRFVVFDVGGIININSVVSVKSNITIAGQTAPGGISIYGDKVSFTDANQLIARHFAVRKGNAGVRNDSASLARGGNMIFDHMSVTWGVDETFSMNPDSGAVIDNITIQNTIVAQGLDRLGHSAGGLMTLGEGGRFSVIKSLFADNVTRNPKVRGENEFINNVVYGYETAGYIMGDTDGMTSHANVEGNYFIEGPVNGSSPFASGTSSFNIYARDNWVDANKDSFLNGSLNNTYPGATVLTTRNNFPTVATLTAQQAVAHVIQNVGVSIARDAVDTRIVQEMASFGTFGGVIDRETDLFPNYGVGTAYTNLRGRLTDSDGDVMPDNWEIARGLNPASNADWKNLNGDYTRLEDYLNEIGGDGKDKFWTSATGTWATTASWIGGSPTFADQAFVRGNGAGTNATVTLSTVGPSARRLFIGGTGAAAGEKVTVNVGGTLDVFDTLQVGYENNGTLEIAGGTVTAGQILVGAPGYSGTLALNSGTLQAAYIYSLSPTSVLNWNGGTIKSNANPLITVATTLGAAATFDSNGYSGELAGAISGIGTLNKSGAGTLTLSGNNSYSGGTNLNTGNLKLASSTGAGTGQINVANTASGVILGDGVIVSNTIKTNYNFEVIDVIDAGASATFAGALIKNQNSNQLRIQASGAGATLNVTGSITAGTSNFFIKTGNVVLAGNGAISGTGGAVGRGGALATNLTVQDNATFNIGGFSMGGGQGFPSGSITVAGNASLSTGTGNLDLLSTSTAASTSALNLNGGTTTVGSIIKSSVGATQTSSIKFNGGTLKYGGTVANPNFLNALTGLTTSVSNGGAKIDDSGQAISINAALTHDALGSAKDGGLVKFGAGSLTLTNNLNAYTGDTTVLAGSLKLGAAEVIPHGAGKGNVWVESTFDLNGISATVNSLTGTATGIVDNSAAGTVTLTVGDANTGNTATPFNGTIRNTGGKLSLTKIGAGTFRMQNNSSTYSGDTVVQSGTLDLNILNALPFGTTAGNVQIDSAGTLGIRFAQSFNGLNGAGTLQSLNSGTKTVTLGNGNAAGAFSGLIQNGSGPIALTKTGTGTQTLSGLTNSFTGAISVDGGTLSAAAGNAFGTGATSALGATNIARNINVNNGGTLRFAAGDVLAGNGVTPTATLVINAGGTVSNNGASFNTLGPITLNGGTLTGTGGSGNAQFQMYQLRGNVTIGGTTASTISASGATAGYHLNGAITFAVSDATANSASDLNVSAALINGVGATPVFGGVIKSGLGTMTVSGASTFSGNIDINAGTLSANLTNNVFNPVASALGNPQAARNINVNTGGTLKFVGADTFGSATTNVVSTLVVNGGTVTNNGNNFNTLGAVQLNGGTLTGTGGAVVGYQMYNLRGSVTVGGSTLSTLSGSGANSGYHLAGNTTFNVADVAAGTDLAVSGALINQDATNTGNGGLTKSGLGTMVLTGANTYGGATNINAGTLVVGVAGVGSISGTGTVTVNSTGTLAGSGSVAGGVTVASGGTLAPGNSPGLFTTGGNVTLGGSYAWEFDNGGAVGTAGTNYDQLVMTNASATLALGGTVDVSLTTGNYASSFWDSNHQWTIISTANGSGTTGSFSGITAPGSTGEGVFTYSTSGGSVVLDWTAAVTGNTVTLVSGSSNSPVLAINGGNGSYIGASADVTGATGGVNITGFNPATDAPVLIALDIENLSGSLSDFLSSITAPAGYTLVSATDISSSVPGWVTQVNQFSQSINDWEALLTFAPTTPNGSPFDFNWNFTGNGGAIVDRIAVVPEPATFGVVGALGAIGLLKRRRRQTP